MAVGDVDVAANDIFCESVMPVRACVAGELEAVGGIVVHGEVGAAVDAKIIVGCESDA